MPCSAFSSCRLCRFLFWHDSLSFTAMFTPESMSKKTICWFDMLQKVADGKSEQSLMANMATLLGWVAADFIGEWISDWEQKRRVICARCLLKFWKVFFAIRHLSFLCADPSQGRKLYRFNSTWILNIGLCTGRFTVWSDRQILSSALSCADAK